MGKRRGAIGVSKGKPKPGAGAAKLYGSAPKVNQPRGSGGRMGALTNNAVRPSGS